MTFLRHMRRVLVTDWDESATLRDTTMLVAKVAYENKKNLPAFLVFSNIYLDACKAYEESVHYERDCIENEIKYQEGMESVEMSSIAAIEQCGLFLGLRLSQFADKASEVVLRPGFVEFVKAVRHENEPTYVLSVNWSKTLIEATLAMHGVLGVIVLANDFQTDVGGLTTGRFCDPAIRTGADKWVHLKAIKSANPGTSVVYVGDSSGDVLPLLEADIGVVIDGGRAVSTLQKLRTVEPIHGTRELSNTVYLGGWEDLHEAWKK